MFNREKDWFDFVAEFSQVEGSNVDGLCQNFRVFHSIYLLWVITYGGTFAQFCDKVRRHIVNYAIKQYGDSPNDQVQEWSIETCEAQAQKYLNRRGKNVREDQDEMDLFKAAHFIQIAWTKKREK